MLLYYFWN